MSTVITAGNATNGLSLSADNAGSFQFKTGTGAGTTAMTIDASQNVGFGTTTPYTSGGSKGVEIASSIQPGLILNNTAASGHRYITFSNTDGGFGNYDITDSVFVNTYAPGASGYHIFNTNGVERMRINASGNVTVTSVAGLGYGTGAGGTVTQTTNKATAVVLNKPTGQITMSNAALAANTAVAFVVSNTILTSSDIVIVNAAGGIGGSYRVEAYNPTAGAFVIRVTNITGGSLSEALILNFAVIKGATS
jgi:hypothetical protein